MKRILLVEDDRNLAEGMILNLEAEGYEVFHIADGSEVIAEVNRGVFDLILLDIMLPGIDGLTICRKLRSEGHTLPILFVTARDQTDEKVAGILAGGDDYITKPFSIEELLARIKGIFRRQSWLSQKDEDENHFEFDGRSVNFDTLEAVGPGGKQTLTRKECLIVKYLVNRAGDVVSRDQLLDAVWGYDAFPTTRTVDNFILRLRKIFEDDPKEPKYFETVHGVGYRFKTGDQS
jgi:two-component system alkaline phosphatase synthesis response regulator PhoP